MNGRIPQNGYHITRIECFRNNGSLADKFSDIGSLSRKIIIEQILGLNDPERGVLVALEHWQSRVRAVRKCLPQRFRSFRKVKHADLVTRCHHCTNWQITKAHDASDHLLLARLQNSCIFRLNNKCPDLVFTDLVLWIAAVPDKPK